jgi:uncharacterized protein
VILVDSSAWFARYSSNDPHHVAATQFHRAEQEEFVTTDYIIDEVLTLLKVRISNERAIFVGHELFSRELARIEWVTEEDISAAWEVFHRFRDKDWSFTDCVSYVVMQRMGITKAFAFDLHFRQFGTVTVVP